MRKIKVIRPDQLPNTAGLIGFTNNHDEIGHYTASRTVSDRWDIAKADRTLEAIKEGINSPKWDHLCKGMDGRGFFIKYPEAAHRLVYEEMDYELADSQRKQYIRTGQTFKSDAGDFKDDTQRKINALQKQIEKLKQTA